MRLQAALNGDRTKAEHAATPVSVEELARDAAACVAAGARMIHLHPRDFEGRETLEAGVVDEVVKKVRGGCGVPVGTTTSAEIEPDPECRLGLVRAWREPDYASVNLSEAGALELMEALVGIGVGIEAGVWTVEDAERLAASGLGVGSPGSWSSPGSSNSGTVEGTRQPTPSGWSRTSTVPWTSSASPRLQHGDGRVTWVLLRDAVRRGLEDTLRGPDGERTTGNVALVRAARELGTA